MLFSSFFNNNKKRNMFLERIVRQFIVIFSEPYSLEHLNYFTCYIILANIILPYNRKSM